MRLLDAVTLYFTAGVVAALSTSSHAAAVERWVCRNTSSIDLQLQDADGNKRPSIGECLRVEDNQARNDLITGNDETVVVPLRDFKPPVVASLLMNKTCGGWTIVGLNGTETTDSPGQQPGITPPEGFECPKGQLAVQTQVEVPSRITTTVGRGVGVPVSSCDKYGQDFVEDAGLCYEACKPGYFRSALLCIADCPKGFSDQGFFCGKPGSYGRGAGGCHNAPYGCEKWGLIDYPKCAPNFHNFGCCVCSPNCPDGWHDNGVSCTKPSYGGPGGVGKPLGCKGDQVYDAGICYHTCPSTSPHGVGPLCYGSCTADNPYRLGIWCYHSESERNEILGAIIGGVLGGAILATIATVVALPIIVPLASAAAAAAPLTIASTGPLDSSIVLIGAIAVA